MGDKITTERQARELSKIEPERRAVEVALREFGNLSNAELGRICGVNDKTIAAHRAKNLGNSEVETRIGADGKERRMPTRKQPEPDDGDDGDCATGDFVR